MGVDAQMLLKMKHEPTIKELKEMQYNIMHRIGKDLFWTKGVFYKDGTYKKDESRMFLSIVEEYLEDSNEPIVPTDGETLVKVDMSCRYYGPGYERGPGMEIASLMLFLNGAYPNIIVCYGGDSSGILAEEFNMERSLEFLMYYLEHGNAPYFCYFDKSNNINPKCSYCNISMNRHGWGKRYASFGCLGCEEERQYRDEEYDELVKEFPHLNDRMA